MMLDDMARDGFDLNRWATGWRNGVEDATTGHLDDAEPQHDPPSWWAAMVKDLGGLLDPIGIDGVSFSRSRAFLRGYATAMRLVWASLEQGQAAEAPSVTEGGDGDR